MKYLLSGLLFLILMYFGTRIEQDYIELRREVIELGWKQIYNDEVMTNRLILHVHERAMDQRTTFKER
jgi:hypothetical protein